MLIEIDVADVIPNPQQPRVDFSEVELRSLANSMKENGLLSPIIVEKWIEKYILIDGERRLRAARLLGWRTIQAIARPPMNGDGQKERSVLALVANLQRANLNPIEEAHAFEKLSELGLSNNTIAHRLGISSARVASRRGLLQLEEEIQDLAAADLLPTDPRAVAAIRSVPDEHRIEFARKLARPGLKIKTVVQAAERLNAALRAERISAEPAIYFAHRKAGAPSLPDWDALHQLGKLPLWSEVVKASIHTCQTCELRGEASAVICGRCPAVTLLATMIEASHEHQRAH